MSIFENQGGRTRGAQRTCPTMALFMLFKISINPNSLRYMNPFLVTNTLSKKMFFLCIPLSKRMIFQQDWISSTAYQRFQTTEPFIDHACGLA